jgi:tetratricopeptide (TPR) repeat protein
MSGNLRIGGCTRLAVALCLIVLTLSCASKEEKKAKHFERAKQYIQQNELNKAVIELKNVVQLDPKSDAAYFELGETYMKLKQGREAFDAFSRATSINANNLEAQLRVGQILLLGRKPEEAKKRAELILEKSPNHLEGLSLLSGIQLQENDSDGAVKTLEKAVSIDPNNFKVQLSLARLLTLKGKPDQAEQAYQKAISLDASSSVPYVELSRIYASKGQWEKAEAELKQMVEASGANSQNLGLLAAFYESNGRLEQAEKTYQDAANAAPNGEVGPLMNLGSYYARRNSYEQALQAMNKAMSIKGDDLNIPVSIAQLHLDFNKISEAEATLDKVLEKDKGHVNGNFLKARIDLAKRDFPKALERLDLVLKERPRSDLAHYFRALALLGKGEPKLAQQDLQRAVEMNPNFLDARIMLAEFYLRERNKELAAQQIAAVSKQAPENVRVLTLQANLKILQGEPKAAEALFEKVVGKTPNEASAHLRLGLVYNLTGQAEKAMKSFRKSLELNPMQSEALGLIVNSYIRDKKPDEALKVCEEHRKKIGESPANTALIEFLEGSVYVAKKDFKSAQERFEKAIEAEPNLLSAYAALAGIYVSQNRLDDAIKQYEAVIQKNPKFVAGYMTLGVIYEQKGNGDKAETYYRKVLELNKDFAPAANNLAWNLAERGKNIDEALGFAQVAKEKMPKSAAVMDTLGWLYYLKGSYLNAVAELQESVALEPDNPVITYHLGMAYFKNAQMNEAKASLEKALKIHEKFKGADEARKALEEIKAKG